jgi:hypothetical protein
VTHAFRFLNRVDKVLVMVNGGMEFFVDRGRTSILASLAIRRRKVLSSLFIQKAILRRCVLKTTKGAGDSAILCGGGKRKKRKDFKSNGEQRGAWLV